MKTKIIGITIILLLSFVTVFANSPVGAGVTDVGSFGPLNESEPSSINITAGYINQVSLTANVSTIKWAGIFGNVSGNIQLGDGVSENVMFNWVAQGNLVYSSEAGAPSWATLATTTPGDIDAALSYMSASDSDSATNTFVGASESIGSNLFTLSSVFATTLSNGGNNWKTYALTDGADFVYAGKVDVANENYVGGSSDFQMIVPEDGTAGDSNPTTYSIWVELI
jgi:hypothetical protein